MCHKKKREAFKNVMIEIKKFCSESETTKMYTAMERIRQEFQHKLFICSASAGDVISEHEKVMERRVEHFSVLMNRGRGSENQTDELDNQTAKSGYCRNTLCERSTNGNW